MDLNRMKEMNSLYLGTILYIAFLKFLQQIRIFLVFNLQIAIIFKHIFFPFLVSLLWIQNIGNKKWQTNKTSKNRDD